MVEHAGLALQRILKHEYADVYEAGSGVTEPAAVMKQRNPALSKYMPFEALLRLHQQFKSYLCAQDPFNHKRRSTQSTFQWWSALEGDELADVLAVSLHFSTSELILYMYFVLLAARPENICGCAHLND